MVFPGLRQLFVTVFLYYSAMFMVVPAITDVTMSALCPGMDECSIAIYLSGFQQVIIGLGTLVMMPIVGNLSDEYGRKTLLTLPMTLTIIPLVILAYSRTKYFFYVYYVLRILTSMLCEGSVQCLSLAYVADNIPEGQRASAFGILSGIVSTAFVCGTLTARFLSTALTFQVSATVAVLAALYMKLFLKDSISGIDTASMRTISKKTNNVVHFDGDSSRKIQLFRRIPSVDEIFYLLRISPAFSQAAVVAFFNNFSEGALHSSLLFFLKARFHFSKDQFADLLLIAGFAGAISQLVLMPILAPFLGEEKLLIIGLFAGCTHMFLYAVAWSSWVPYVASMFSILVVFAPPCIRSIASKQVGPSEQGKAQGCLSGICSFANIVSPLAFTPLTALFLSENAPFHFPGFSIMCIGFSLLIACIQSTMIRATPPISSHKTTTSNCVEA
ncbi:hippocampus abundant transcript-like protein 1 isoform X2 [Telopea speciosissima]|uniref:hippocampus abundant transcript-like protein 1 isoform X2 n=1 Tax=Telopea speciosissima TaxID=54955 RepID=UPI001CC7C394|nr:hippocampus abundant transcript-like protein 1 isoform X2 [Telopea speciosissima]